MTANNGIALNSATVAIADRVQETVTNSGVSEHEAAKLAAQEYLDNLIERFGTAYRFRVQTSTDLKSLTAYQVRTVVDKVADKHKEISRAEMQKTGREYDIGENVLRKLPAIEFDRFPLMNSAIHVSMMQITEN